MPSVRSSRGLREKPWDARLDSDHVTDIAKMRTSRYGASAGPSRAGRSIGFLAMLATTTTARSKTADPTGASRGDEFGRASTPQFDDAARSLPAPRSVRVRGSLPVSSTASLAGIVMKAGYRLVFETTNEFVRIKF